MLLSYSLITTFFFSSALGVWAKIVLVPCLISWVLPMQTYNCFYFFSLLALFYYTLHTYFLSLFTGGTGPTSDTGWGCMLRCGQMIFAQALVCRHLGRGKSGHGSYWLPGPCASTSAVLIRTADNRGTAGNCWVLSNFFFSLLKFRAVERTVCWKPVSRFFPAVYNST